MIKYLSLKLIFTLGIVFAMPIDAIAQTKSPDITQIENKQTSNNVIFEQPGLNVAKTAEPIIIAVPKETQNEIIAKQVSKSTSKKLVEPNPAIIPKDPNNVMLKQPSGKDACDDEKIRNSTVACKNPIEKRASEFENAMRPEINLENQELSQTKENNISLSKDANKTAQKAFSANEIEALAAAAVAQTYIAGQNQPNETPQTDKTTLPDNVVDLINNNTQPKN